MTALAIAPAGSTLDAPALDASAHKSFIQDTAYEIHKTLSAIHRVVNAWSDHVGKAYPKDPMEVVRAARGTAQTLNALADQIEMRME